MTDLPQGWREISLGELTEIKYGKSLDKSLRSDVGLIPVVGSAGVMTQTDIPFVMDPCVVVGRKGNVGSVQYFPDGCYPIDTVYYFTAPIEMLPNYLNLSLESKKLKDLDSSTAIPSLRRDDLESVQVSIPPFAEQERIVEILEEQFSRLDSALASVKAVREKAKAFRRSLLHSAFSGELTGGTEGWREVALGEIADVGWGDLKVTKNSYVDDGYTAYSATGPDGKLPYFDYDQTGIIVSAIGAQCGKVFLATGKWSCIKNTMRILSTKEEVSINYLFHLLSTDFLPKRGSGQPFIGQKDAREALVSIPPITTQERIVSVLEEQFSKLDKALEVANQLEARIASERRSLLHAAFTGELTSQWRKTHV